MKIHNRLALLLLTAGLAACGSNDPGGAKGDPLTSTGVVITSEPVVAPTAATKATVGFRVIFPEPDGAAKAALNPAMTTVTITTAGACGVASLALSPTTTSGTLSLLAGECTFTANAFDSFNAKIDSATTQGTLLAGPNDISLTFLGGPWLFVNPTTNEKLPLNLAGGEVLTGIRLTQDFAGGTLLTRWIGPDTLGNGPTADDLMGGALINTDTPTMRVTGSFTGGTGLGTNLVRLNGGFSNLTDWKRSFLAGQRVISILGSNFRNPTTFNPSNYLDYYTTKVIDGTTIEGNIVEYTMDSSSNSAPYGSCSAVASKATAEDAFVAALNAAHKAQTSIGTVTASWTFCDANNMYQDVTRTHSNVTIHPFRAESAFADPASAMQVQLNNAVSNYKQALATESTINGLNMATLRKAASQFVSAADLAGDNLSNTADTARFFGAISRLASLAVDTTSDGVTNGLNDFNDFNDFNDVLDALGVPADATSRSWSKWIKTPETCVTVGVSPYTYQDCKPNLPATAPRSGEILTLLDSKLNTQLDLAIADLSRISAGFSYNFSEPSGATTNFDYGDVLALTAIAHGIKAELAIDMAYDLDLDIDATINGTGPASVQQFMLNNSTLGTLNASRYAAELAQAKTDLQTALTTMQSAMDVIEAEVPPSPENEFISFYSTDGYCDPAVTTSCSWIVVDRTAEEIANFRDAISKALTGLNGPVTVDDNGTLDITSDDSIIDPSKFFAGIDFRSLIPTFSGDNATSLFPDPTMGGVLVQTPDLKVNQDFDDNNVPDLLEDANFYSALLSGKTYSFNWSTWLKGYNVSWPTLRFNGDKTVSADWNYTNYATYPYVTNSGTATGSWSILSTGELKIDFSANSPLSLVSIVADLERQVNAQLSPIYFETNMTFTYSDLTVNQYYMRWNEKASVSLIIR